MVRIEIPRSDNTAKSLVVETRVGNGVLHSKNPPFFLIHNYMIFTNFTVTINSSENAQCTHIEKLNTFYRTENAKLILMTTIYRTCI